MLWHIPRVLQDNAEFAAIFEPFKHALVQVALPWNETFPDRAGFQAQLVSSLFKYIQSVTRSGGLKKFFLQPRTKITNPKAGQAPPMSLGPLSTTQPSNSTFVGCFTPPQRLHGSMPVHTIPCCDCCSQHNDEAWDQATLWMRRHMTIFSQNLVQRMCQCRELRKKCHALAMCVRAHHGILQILCQEWPVPPSRIVSALPVHLSCLSEAPHCLLMDLAPAQATVIPIVLPL